MHIPVLLQEVVDGLRVKKGDIVLDATVGGGGHSKALCEAIGRDLQKNGDDTASGQATFVCLDEDEDAIERSRARLTGCGCQFLFFRTNYRHLDAALASFGIPGINKALFDLGLSSQQLDPPVGGSTRGFSFRGNEPLTMTFAKNAGPDALTAEKIVNEWDEKNIATILESYGGERMAKRIVSAIARARKGRPIATTGELREIIERAVPRRGKLHPATKTFQALRVAVNDEFRALQEGLAKAWGKLLLQGRLAVISFHSIEDRTVKDFFREQAKAGAGKLITKKPIAPARGEVLVNPRARSAKLRIIEKA